jgi:hypothetical protein
MDERAADQHTNIAYVHFLKEDYPEAHSRYREAQELYSRSGCEEKRALAAGNADRLAEALGMPE